jgi:hypothetical protein
VGLPRQRDQRGLHPADTITDVGSEAFLMESQLDDIIYVETWKCTPDGVVNMQSDGGLFSALFAGSSGLVKSETVSVQGMTLPLSIAPGDEWDQTTEVTFTSPSASGPATLTHKAEAIGPESVTVPAGTFEARRIDVQSTMQSALFGGDDISFEATYWLVPELGLVRMAGAGEALGTEFKSEIELVAASLP